MLRVFELVRRSRRRATQRARSAARAGTGKELVARGAARAEPARSDGPFVAGQLRGAPRDACSRPSCSATSKGRVHRRRRRARGAIRGGRRRHAVPRRDRRDRRRRMQVKLLRVLQERKFERVGGDRDVGSTCGSWPRPTATSTARSRDGPLPRGPLLPPQRGHAARAAAARAPRGHARLWRCTSSQRYAREDDKHIRGFSDRALRVLINYEWPGNVRELENCDRARGRAVPGTGDRAASTCRGRSWPPPAWARTSPRSPGPRWPSWRSSPSSRPSSTSGGALRRRRRCSGSRPGNPVPPGGVSGDRSVRNSGGDAQPDRGLSPCPAPAPTIPSTG